MIATGWLVRRRLRRRWPALLAVAAVVALGFGGALVALGAAIRTDGAYAAYLERADVGDVVINPSLFDREVDAAFREAPGVRAVTHDAMFLAGIDDGHPWTRAEFEADPSTILIRGSPDGRRIDMDRPAISEGRPIAARDEVLVTREVAEARGLAPGDRLQISFWNSSQDLLAELDDTVRPIAVEDVTVAGVATLPDEVLADDLFPRGQVVVSPELARIYDCLPSLPPVDTPMDEVIPVLLPDGCSTSYPYYSLDLAGGAAGVAPTLEALTATMADLNTRVPTALAEFGAVHAVIATTTADEQARVERSVQPTVAALGALALGAAAVAALVLGLAVAARAPERRGRRRAVAPERHDRPRARRRPPGAARPGRGRGAGGRAPRRVAGVAARTGGGGAGRRPRARPGAGRLVPARDGGARPRRRRRPPRARARAARRAEPGRSARGEERLAPTLIRATGEPAVREGLRAALGRRRGTSLVVASGGAAVGVLLSAVVFGGTLDTVLRTPADYGWTWDVGVLGGFGYGRQDLDAVRESLDGRDDIERWDGVAVGAFSVAGEPVTGLVGLADRAPLDLTMASGRMPTGTDEVALGSRTAAAIGAGIGDEVELGGDAAAPRRVRVTGIAVLPGIGRYQSDRAAPGVGVVVPPGLVAPDAEAGQVTFVGLHLAPGADPATVALDLRDDTERWAAEGDPAFVYHDPVRPPEIADADAMRRLPLLVGALLAAAAAIGLVTAVVVSVRARRRELGTLRALGFTSRQLRTSVRVQALATMAAALVVGVPLGLVVGRLAWRAFATRLGIVTNPTMPWAWIAATVAGALVVAVVAAAWPGRCRRPPRRGPLPALGVTARGDHPS